MSGFEFTPAGIVPLAAPTVENAIAPAAVAAPAASVVPDRKALEPSRKASSIEAPAASAGKPLNVCKLARARLKEIEREIKRLQSLEKERDELRRLLDAAKTKPLAVVRGITAAKRG